MHVTSILKSHTADLHRQTEAILPTDKIVAGTLSLSAYTAIIQAQYLIFQSLESYLQVHLTNFPGLDNYYKYKLPWLQEDLRELNQPLPPPLDVQHPSLPAAGLTGILYVMEGSMLGGRVIVKSLNANNSLKGLSHRFYRGYEKDTGSKWKEFRVLCDKLVSSKETEVAVSGAEYTFRFFQKVFIQLKLDHF